MDIIRSERSGVVVLCLSGRLDAYTASSLYVVLVDTISQKQRKLIVDLTEVTFLDSAGLGALVGGMKRARQGGGDLRLVGLHPDIGIIFELTRLDCAFEILDDVNAGVRSYAR